MLDSAEALNHLPATLRDELLEAYGQIVDNYREGRWEPSELNGGKLCEVVYSILNGYISGVYPARASKPANMVDACNNLAQASAGTFSRSVRIQIPRVLISLYEVRNNRGVGHVGGEVDPNHMDATMVLYSSKWVVAELVRIFHDLDTIKATKVVEALMDRVVPLIWEVNGKKRILKPGLSMKDKTLLILYSESDSIAESDLVDWVEHTNAAVYRRDILVKGHKSKLWEYDKSSRSVSLSPVGVQYVESKLLFG